MSAPPCASANASGLRTLSEHWPLLPFATRRRLRCLLRCAATLELPADLCGVVVSMLPHATAAEKARRRAQRALNAVTPEHADAAAAELTAAVGDASQEPAGTGEFLSALRKMLARSAAQSPRSNVHMHARLAACCAKAELVARCQSGCSPLPPARHPRGLRAQPHALRVAIASRNA